MKFSLPGLLLILTFTNGCADTLNHPLKKNEYFGSWESAGFIPYAKLELDDAGNGVLIAIYSTDHHSIFTLSNFTLIDSGFSVDLREISEDDRTEKFYGHLFNDQLNLRSEAEDDRGTWFTRSEKITVFKNSARNLLEKFPERNPDFAR